MEEGACGQDGQKSSTRTTSGFSSNSASLWFTAFCISNPQLRGRRSGSADSCREQGRKNGCTVLFPCLSVCSHSFWTSVFLCSYLKLKRAAFNPASTRIPAFFLMNAGGKYWMLGKGRIVNRAKDGKAGLSWDICISRGWEKRWWKAFCAVHFMLLVRPLERCT